MPKKSDLLSFILYLIIFGLLVAAIAFLFIASRTDGVPGIFFKAYGGMMLIAVGVGAIVFSRMLAKAQLQLPFIPRQWKQVRSSTFVLFGTGVFIIGIANVFLWY